MVFWHSCSQSQLQVTSGQANGNGNPRTKTMQTVIETFSSLKKEFGWNGTIGFVSFFILSSLLFASYIFARNGPTALAGKTFCWCFLPNQTALLRLTGFMENWPCWHVVGGAGLRLEEKRKKESRQKFDLFDLKMYCSVQTHSDKTLRRFSFSFQYRKKINSATLKVIMKWNRCSPASSKSIINGLGFGLAAQVLSWQDSTVISALPQANTWQQGD